MMSEVILAEFETVGTAIVSGAFITFVYDLLRIFRRVLPHGNVWIGVEDFFFWIWTTFWIFSVLYRENDGSLRFYTIFAMVLGMVVYHQSVSDFFVNLIAKILKKLLAVLKKIYKGIIISKNR